MRVRKASDKAVRVEWISVWWWGGELSGLCPSWERGDKGRGVMRSAEGQEEPLELPPLALWGRKPS